MLRAVYFDYHGVLDRREFSGLVDLMIKAIPHAHDGIRTQLEPKVFAYATGETAPIVFWNAIAEAFGPNVAQVGKQYQLHVEPIREMWELINQLHQRFSVGLFTDCAADKRDVIIRSYNLPEFFDQLIFSCDVRETKIDPNFYRRMLRDGLYQPGECLLIDNSHQSIGLAKSLGFQTHEYKTPVECISFCSRL